MYKASYNELKTLVSGKKGIFSFCGYPGVLGYVTDGYIDGCHYYQLSLYNGRLWSDIKYLEDGRIIDMPEL
jgi:hypothetical protein